MSELKTQIKEELLKQKEEKLKVERELNSKLKEITLYTKPKNPVCEQYKTAFTDLGIKFKEETINKQVLGTVQQNAIPVIHVNNNYLVMGREFQTAEQCVKAIKFFAHPEYIVPDPISKLTESIKNLSYNMQKSFQGLNRQLTPILQLLNSLREEEKVEQKGNAKKTK